MSGLKQLRNRIRSIKSTQKITKAMHVVSAAKLKGVKEQSKNLNEYSKILAEIMYDFSKNDNLIDLPENDRKFFSKSLEQMPHLLVVMTSERGLCGGFNSNVIKQVKNDIKKLKKQGKEVKLLVIGKKGIDVFKKQYSKMVEECYHNTKNNIECLALQVKNKIIQLVEEGQVGACYMYYNRFKNAMTQILTTECILPVKTEIENNILSQRNSITQNNYSSKDKSEYLNIGNSISEYEYEGENLVHDIIHLYIKGEINYGLLQSRASEEGARMTAMDNATRNAGELIDNLTLKLNRSRQTIITTELTEIISGAESL